MYEVETIRALFNEQLIKFTFYSQLALLTFFCCPRAMAGMLLQGSTARMPQNGAIDLFQQDALVISIIYKTLFSR